MKLFKIHMTFLYTKRLKWATVIVLLLSLVFFIAIAGFNVPHYEQDYFNQAYKLKYMTHFITYLKWISLLSTIFIVIHSNAYNHYDAFFINMQSDRAYIAGKGLVMLIMMMALTYSVWCIGMGVAVTTSYYDWHVGNLKLLLQSMIFVIYYGSLSIYLISLINHISAVMGPFMGYIMTFLLTDPTGNIEEMSNFLRVLHLLFPDILFNQAGSSLFLWGKWTILALTIMIIMVTYKSAKIRV